MAIIKYLFLDYFLCDDWLRLLSLFLRLDSNDVSDGFELYVSGRDAFHNEIQIKLL